MTTRRRFLRGAAAGAAVLLSGSLGAGRGALAQTATPMPGMSMEGAAPAGTQGAFVPDAEVSLTAVDKLVQLLPGAKTRVWGYEAKLVSGSGVTIVPVEGVSGDASYLGPILHVPTGLKLRIVLKNGLQEKTVLHPHGLRVPEDCDGQPMQAIGPGQTKVYEFPVIDRAGPYWFHPHPMGRTAEQVVMGLAGAFYVHDAAEAAAVPGAATGAGSGSVDVPVIIQDRVFNANNQFLYQPNMMWGYLGDRILVNGQPDAALTLEPRGYRLRLLNGSNARTYKLAWSNGASVAVIGTDSGLLPAPENKPYVMLMPGERVDIWADFAVLAGQKVVLRSLAWDAGPMQSMGGMGMMGSMQGMGGMKGGRGMGGGMGMMSGSSLANGAPFDVLTINVGHTAPTSGSPTQPVLGKLPVLPFKFAPADVPNFATPRTFTLAMAMMMNWTINGRVYEDMAVAADERVKLGATEAWEWVNNSPIPHPMHIHNVQFQVMGRTSPGTAAYAGVADGFVNSGLKDTVAVWPGERVKVAMKFGPHAGTYMYHCHILEHEDMTMMRNYRIEA